MLLFWLKIHLEPLFCHSIGNNINTQANKDSNVPFWRKIHLEPLFCYLVGDNVKIQATNVSYALKMKLIFILQNWQNCVKANACLPLRQIFVANPPGVGGGWLGIKLVPA